MVQRRFVVLDRDGTINIEHSYLSDHRKVELVPGAADGLRQMSEMGMGLVVITNQSGIGRGFFNNECLGLIHGRLCEILEAEGVYLNGIYVCPHTPEDDCQCRKPRPLLIQRASRDLDFEPESCFVIGDKPCDIELGHQVGATTVLVRSGYGHQVEIEGTANPDYVADGLAEAAGIIKKILKWEQ